MGSGRPSKFNKEIADRILALIMDGHSLREICRRPDMPTRSTIHLWVAKDSASMREVNGEKVSDFDLFSDRYANACKIRAYEMFDEMLEIADDGTNDWMIRNGEDGTAYQLNGEALQRSRLRVDTRKWALSKLVPKEFGDKLEVDNTSSDGSMSPQPVTLNMTPQQAAEAYAAMISKSD